MHVAVISAQGIPERDGYLTKYSEAKVYVALNFRGVRKCTKVVTQSAQGVPIEWADEIIWKVDYHPSGTDQEHMAVEVCWESSIRDQKIGAVAVTVPSTKEVVQQKLWQLETTKSSSPVGILLQCWISDTSDLEANERRTVEAMELSEPSIEAPVDYRLDNITLGMYKVNVEVIEARGLPSRPSRGICSPCVSVQIDGGKKFFTSCVTRSGEHAAWYEAFSFDLNVNDPMDLRRAKLLLKCLDEGFISNQLIGSFDIELAFIYSQSNHEIFRRWITLFNFQDEEAKGIQGLILLSVSVLGPGDNAAIHNDSDHLANAEDKSESGIGILVSPSVERRGYLVELRIHRAEALPQMDFTVSTALGGQGIDAYVRLKFGGDSYSSRTSIVKNRNPNFNEAIFCPVVLPSYSDTIEVNFMDYDYFDSDDFIATLFFSFQDLVSHSERYTSPQWWNLYGAPPCSDPWPAMPGPGGRMERNARAINKGERAGISWRGRVLMSFHVSPCPLKELKCRTLPTPISPLKRTSNTHNSEPGYTRFLIEFKLYLACNVKSSSKLQILVKIGDQVVCKSAENLAVDGTVSWWETLYGSFEVPLENSALESKAQSVAWHSCPDVFVDLQDQKCRLGFIRVDLKACQNQSDPRWHVILPDEFDGCGPDSGIQGMLLFQARSGIVSEMAPTINVQEKAIPQPQKVRYCLYAHLYLAENLKADNDSINPYVVLSCCGQSWTSKVVDGCQYPAWYESFKIEFHSFQNKVYISPLMIQVFDKNQILTSEVLGFTIISATSLLEKSQEDVIPLWYDLYHPDSSPVHGYAMSSSASGSRILIALQLLPVEREPCKRCGVLLPENATSCTACSAVALTGSHIPTRILPVMKLCTVELFIFALRDLTPCGVLPMAAPFVSASLASINLSTRASYLPTPTSPNVLQSLVFSEILIPINSDFAPAITIRVSDRRFAGLVLLGSTPVHLAEYLPWISIDDRKLSRKARLEREKMAGLSIFPHRTSPNPSHITNSSAPELTVSFKFKVCIQGQIYNVDGRDGHVDGNTAMLSYLKGRQTIDCELEDKLLDDQNIDPCSEDSGLSTYCLTRRVRQYFFSEMLSQCSGRLKMRVRVSEKGHELSSPISSLETSKQSSTYIVRLYVLQAEGLASEDSNGSADPYLLVSLGKQEISRRDFAKIRCLNPVFHQRFEFQTELPGVSILRINVMDADTLTKDDLIGSTIIDLEERIMSKQWMLAGQGDKFKPPLRPVETRRLKTPGSSQCRGNLKLWLDIFSAKEARIFPPWNIAIDPEPYMLRVVVWRVREAKSMDPLSDQNDLYIVGRLVGVNLDGAISTDTKKTDTHWRCKNGVGSFNWRWNFPLTIPLLDLQLTIQAWDHDIVGSDDLVGETTLSLKQMISCAMASENQLPLRFPSTRLIDKTLTQKATSSSHMSKRDRRILHRIKSQLAKGQSPDSIAQQLQQEEGADESQIWTAERINAVAHEKNEEGCDQYIGALKRFLHRALSCLSSAVGMNSVLSPNPTAWLPLYCSGSQDQVEVKSDWCCGCSPRKQPDSWCQEMHAGNMQCTGWIELEAELIPRKYFEEHMSGEGREDPNEHPKLPPPDRVKLTSLWYRPDRLAYEILGPDLCWKMVLMAVVITLIIGLVQTLPLIVTNIYTSGQIASKIPASWSDPKVIATPSP